MEKKELNLDEMEQAAGGKGGSKKELPRKDGVIVYQIERGDSLKKIAQFKRFLRQRFCRFITLIQTCQHLQPIYRSSVYNWLQAQFVWVQSIQMGQKNRAIKI